MSFPQLPPENTDPWYAPFTTAWSAVKAYIDNGLAGKSNSTHTHSGTYEPAGSTATHAAAADPHTGYQRESEKGANSGYAPLDSSGKVPAANLPAGQAPTTDHGQLTGLTDDDHPQYLLRAETAKRMYSLYNSAAVPSAGRMNVWAAGGQAWTIRMSKTDGDGAPFSMAPALIQDAISLTDTANPGISYARYHITTTPIDQGTYWQFNVTRYDTNGPAIADGVSVMFERGSTAGAGDPGDAAHVAASDPHPQYASDSHTHEATGGTRIFAFDATAVGDPGAGRVSIENTGGQTRTFRLSKTDSAGTGLSLAILLPGDGLAVTDNPATPPITGFARYTITTDATDQGTYWQFDGIRDDTQGSTTPPADGTSVRVIFTLASGVSGPAVEGTSLTDEQLSALNILLYGAPASLGVMSSGAPLVSFATGVDVGADARTAATLVADGAVKFRGGKMISVGTIVGQAGVWSHDPSTIAAGTQFPYLCGVEFQTDAPLVKVKLFSKDATMSCVRVIVDGEAVALEPVRVSTDEAWHVLTIDFSGVAKSRRITLEGQFFQFGGIGTEADYSLFSVAPDMGQRWIVVGDSYTSSWDGATLESLFYWDGWAILAGRLLGVDIWNSGIGGTGYSADGGGVYVKYGARFATDVAALAPDVVVFSGGLNDNAIADGVIQADINALFTQCASSLPGTPVIVLSPFSPGNTHRAKMNTIAGFLASAASAHGFTYDPTAVNWLRGNATMYLAADSYHLNQAGYDYLSERFASNHGDGVRRVRLSGVAGDGGGGTDPIENPEDVQEFEQAAGATPTPLAGLHAWDWSTSPAAPAPAVVDTTDAWRGAGRVRYSDTTESAENVAIAPGYSGYFRMGVEMGTRTKHDVDVAQVFLGGYSVAHYLGFTFNGFPFVKAGGSLDVTSAGAQWTGPMAIPLNQLIRVEGYLSATAVRLQVWLDPESTDAPDYDSGVITVSGGPIDQYGVGLHTFQGGLAQVFNPGGFWYMDAIAFDTRAPIGPPA